MLFNSFPFLLLFVPLVLAVFFALGKLGWFRPAVAWLVLASLFYYGWWRPEYLALIIGSVLTNYLLGRILERLRAGEDGENGRGKAVMILGVSLNLGLLGWFKYAGFFAFNFRLISGTNWDPGAIALPLAISFFTFQQIAYLVDTWRGETGQYGFLDYCLFVTFFPQLIAGPIVHHREMMPQFAAGKFFRPNERDLAIGLTVFLLGLFEKVVLADSVARYAAPVFQAAEAGEPMAVAEAWGGAFAYTFQLLFDFCGYSDMAVGLGRMLGLKLPQNFRAPYKARNIIDFWHRWHVTLSRFLRVYLYFPLGGNRKGRFLRYWNLMVTMLLGGLWHGAGWTFVVWGGLNGVFLMINHWWRSIRKGRPETGPSRFLLARLYFRAWPQSLTFLSVVLVRVFFRADTFTGATRVFEAMVGVNVTGLDGPMWHTNQTLVLIGLGFISMKAPTVMEWVDFENAGSELVPADPVSERWRWRPNLGWALVTGAAGLAAILSLAEVSEFLYYNF